MIHELKTWSNYFQAIYDGSKRFEIRKNDRNFKVGDMLWLREWNNVENCYTGRDLHATVTYLIQGEWGLEKDVCVMSIKVLGLRSTDCK